MGRKSVKAERRLEIIQSFAKLLSEQGYSGATISSIASEAGLSAGIIHHYFKNKEEIMEELLSYLISDFRRRLTEEEASRHGDLNIYVSCALGLGPKANKQIARCWVGVFSEAIRNKSLFNKLKRNILFEIEKIQSLSFGKLNDKQSASLFAYVLGALMLGAFVPNKFEGFGAEQGHIFVKSLSN